MTLGARAESASPGLDRVTGGRVKTETEGAVAWVEGREGPAGLRLSGGQFWDNLANSPWRPRTTKTQGGAAADVALPVGLTLSLSYQGARWPWACRRTRARAARLVGDAAADDAARRVSPRVPAWQRLIFSEGSW